MIGSVFVIREVCVADTSHFNAVFREKGLRLTRQRESLIKGIADAKG